MENLSEVLKRVATTRRAYDGGEPPVDGPDDSGEPADVCEICGGRGWYTQDLPVGHPHFGQVVICQCQESRLTQERSERLLMYSNLEHLTRFTFQSIKPEGLIEDKGSKAQFEEAYKAALEYAEGPRGWLVFTGPNGSGKTHLAASIGNRCIERGHVVLFAHVPDLLDHLRASFGPTSEMAYSELFEQVKTTPLLILDGLGSHSTTPWAEEKLQQIINHRYDAELPTVVATASPLEELDEYVVSRLRTEGLSRVVELPGQAADPTRQLGSVDPQMLKRMTFETFEVRGNNPSASQRASLEAALQAAKNFAADPDGWLTLFGDTGVGKTHLAIAIAVERVQSGGSVFFAFVPELLDYLRYTFSPDSSITYDRLFEEVKNTPLLILDDLGQERSSAWANEKLYQIVVHRHNARLPTVVTSMMDFSKERGPISSRVQDPSVGQLIRIDAPDYRNKTRTTRGARRAPSKGRTAR